VCTGAGAALGLTSFRRRSGGLWCKARLGFGEGAGGARLGSSGEGSGKSSGEYVGGFGAEPD
jgi:hypothetical protein